MTADEHVDAGAAARAEATAEREAAATGRLDPADLSITFTPRQILGGFALLAALVMLLRRKRRDPDRGKPD